ncbi:MAG: M23 family metallopeptidase [Treponema sp.]|jgi:murein DD-endopeptidase MepM/ murein hydrolase activator NlpD|nr:M23 family metallopeptidase [Treponema sp.]
MDNLLSNQHVRRRKSPVLKGKPAFISGRKPRKTGISYPAAFSPRQEWKGDFIRQVRQKPLRQKNLPLRPGRDRTGEEKEPRFRPSLSLPLIPAAGLCALLIAAIAAINTREEIPFAWMHRDVIPLPAADSAGEYNMALYAGLVPETGEQGASSENAGEAIPLDLAETFAWKTYTVKKGDSVSGIAAEHAISMDAIIASNGISNVRLLREGQVLKIPNMDGIPYAVKKGDSLSKISQSMGVPLEAILDANDIQQDVITPGESLFIPGARMRNEDLRLALGELFIYPLKGARLTSPFGWRNDPINGVRRHHAAVDLAAPTGTPVKAASDGKVSALGFNSTYGNFIILSHENNYQSMYAHLSAFAVKKGDRVAQGVKIGEVGSTGYSTGPHLHFAIYKNGQAVNPLDFLH